LVVFDTTGETDWMMTGLRSYLIDGQLVRLGGQKFRTLIYNTQYVYYKKKKIL